MNPIAIFHREPDLYLKEFLHAYTQGIPVFLGNPQWNEAEMQAAAQLIPQGTHIEGEAPAPLGRAPENWPELWPDAVFIPTGGTGGKIKFVHHQKKTLRAAVTSLRDAIVARQHSGILHGAIFTPVYHVSGLMPALRAWETKGQFEIHAGKFHPESTLPEIQLPTEGTRLASLVPTQLHRILQNPHGVDWLKQFHVILLGGSAVPATELESIRQHRLPVYITYGMTETAAVCAWCPPEKIWAGEGVHGFPLPKVHFTAINQRLCINSPALGLGYWPNEKIGTPYLTGDLGVVFRDGAVQVHGRADRIIVTGGEKVNPAEVEKILLSNPECREVHVFGSADPEWGERIVACVVGDKNQAKALIETAQTLPQFARPKDYLFVTKIPLDDRGKFDRRTAEKLLRG